MKNKLLFNLLTPFATSNTEKKAKRFRNLLALVVMVMGMGVSWGQVSYTSGAYTQNFDTLAATSGATNTWTNNITLAGWYLFTSQSNAITSYGAETGTSGQTTFNSYGQTTGNSERALGGQASGGTYWGSPSSGSIAGWMAIQITNGSGGTLNSITIGFDGEQWRKLDNASAQTMVLEYGFGPTFSGVTTWIAPGNSFNWATPVFSSAAVAAVNGNLAGLVSSRGGTISGLTWASSQNLWIRWVERNDTGNDHALAIDNFTFSASASATPSIALSSPSQIAAGNVNQGATSHILSNFQAAVTVANASLNSIAVVTDGTYSTSSHVRNYKLMYNASSNTFGSAIQIGTTQPNVASASTITFSSLNTTITNGNTGYFWITADIDANATAAQTVSIAANPTFTFASGSPTGSISASGAQTFVAVTPNIAISSNHPTASSINQNATNQVFGSIALATTTANASLNSVAITTAGTYQTSDLVTSSFKLYYTTTNTFATTTQLGSGQAIVASGNTITFSGLSQTINSGVTGYLWFTADVAYNAVNGRTLSTTSTVFTNITFASGNKTGTDPVAAGNDHTVTTVTPNVTISQVGPTVGNIINNINNQILYQLSLVTADNATDINSLTLTTAGTYVPSDLTANGFKLWYNTVNSLSGATQLGTGQGIVSTGNTITFSGLTQKLNIGTSFLLLTVDVASGATPGNDINITSTPFTNISLSAGNKLGTDPSAGGLKTIRIDIAVGDVVINQFSPDYYSGATNEYVEIVNKTGNTIDLSTLKLAYQSASGSLAGLTGATLSGNLLPYSFWLLSTDSTITVGLTSSLNRDGSFTSGFSGSNGQIAIQRVSDNTIIDAVGYGTLTGGTFSEGTSASAPPTDGGLKRVTDGGDSDVNSTDFSTVTNANIYLRNSNSRLGIAGSTIGAGTYTDFVVTGNTSLSGAVNVTNRLSLIGGTLTTGDNLTLKSSSTGTANVPAITGAISGNVTVERYIPAKRAWRALTAPLKGAVSDASIFSQWQNGGTVSAGTGVELWGPEGVVAPTTLNSGLAIGPFNSILQYNNTVAGSWTPVTDTNSTKLFTTNGNNAFMVFPTGGYGSGLISSTSTPVALDTTLKATGQLITGQVDFLSVPSASHTLIGNPYASPISPSLLLAGNTSFGNNLWIWDANAAGTYGVGAYNSYDKTANTYTNVTNNTVFASTPDIQSGQAFFVIASSAPSTLTISESFKSSSATATTNIFLRDAAPAQLLRVGLYKQTNTEWSGRDGAMAVFISDAEANQVTNKMANGSENVAFTINGTLFASEHHLPLVASDVLNVRVWNTTAGANYKLKINTEQFNTTNLDATLEDVFTNSRTPLTLDGTAVEYPFTVTTEATSTGDRFRIVFENSALGINNPKASGISILPNPITGDAFQVNLGTLSTGTYSYSISNALGQEVENGSINNVTQNTSYTVKFKYSTANGMYIMKVTGSDNSVFTAKIIKQ